MATSAKGLDQTTVPAEFAQVPPQDPYRNSELRIIIPEIGRLSTEITRLSTEVGKLSANVDRLISDVSTLATKVDTLRNQVTFVKGAIWLFGAIFALAAFLLSGKWNAIVAAFHAT